MNVRVRLVVVQWIALICGVSGLSGANEHAAFSLINGKDLSGWKTLGPGTNQWIYGKAALNPNDPARLTVIGPGNELINTNKTVNLSSEASFGDCVVELEFMVGKSSPE